MATMPDTMMAAGMAVMPDTTKVAGMATMPDTMMRIAALFTTNSRRVWARTGLRRWRLGRGSSSAIIVAIETGICQGAVMGEDAMRLKD